MQACSAFLSFDLARLAWGGRRGRRAQAQACVRMQYPNEPWKWRPDWAAGRIPSQERTVVGLAWVFAGVWNAIAWPLAWRISGELARGSQGARIALILPLVGVGLLVWAVRTTLRWRRFGASLFEIDATPGVLGGTLRGTIQVGSSLRPPDGFRVRLLCLRRGRAPGRRNHSTQERVLWEDACAVPPTELTTGPRGTGVPVAFSIPLECEPSSPLPDPVQIVWRLEASACAPGVDYASSFEVPVFRTDRSAPPRDQDRGSREGGASDLGSEREPERARALSVREPGDDSP